MVISDNGPQFACHQFHGFAEQYGFHHVTSSPRHPQSNELVERGVQTVKGLLNKAQQSGGDFQLAWSRVARPLFAASSPTKWGLVNGL